MDKQDVACTHDDDSFRKAGEEEHAQFGEPIGEVKLEEEGQHERRQRLLRQAFKVFLSSLGMWSMGSMFSFASVMASDLENNNTTIYGTPISLSNTQMDMISSLLVFCSLPGTLLMAPLMVLFGRRPCMMISGVLLILGWLGVVFLPGVAGIMVGRALSGVAIGGVSFTLNTYGIELGDPDVRGIMGVIINNGIYAGQVVTMGVGYNARYFTVALINLALPIAFLISQIWLPESPGFLVVKGRLEEARVVISNLRGRFVDVDAEIKEYLAMNQSTKKGSFLSKELVTPHTLKSIAIVAMLFIFMQFSGYKVVNANASRIFAEAGSSIDDSLAAIIVITVELLSSTVALFLIDRLGRKKSLMLSFSIMCVPLAVLAAYLSVVDPDSEGEHRMFGWIPLVCLMVSQAGVVLGVNPIPFILSNEYFPTSIRSQASSICSTMSTISSVLVLQLYSPMQEGLTQTGLFAFYSSVCAIGVPFSFFFVKETMGQSVG